MAEKETYAIDEVMELIRKETFNRDLEMENRHNGTIGMRVYSNGEWVVYTMPDPTGAMSYVIDAMNLVDECEECDALYEISTLLDDALMAYMRYCEDVTITREPYEESDGE